jgi:hypothetical protein
MLVQALADPVTGVGSVGTIQVTAALAPKAPTTTPTGTYRTTLIITVVRDFALRVGILGKP